MAHALAWYNSPFRKCCDGTVIDTGRAQTDDRRYGTIALHANSHQAHIGTSARWDDDWSAIVLKRLLGERPIESGIFAGLSTLAVVAAINDTNGGLYVALMAQFSKPRDAAAFSIMSRLDRVRENADIVRMDLAR